MSIRTSRINAWTALAVLFVFSCWYYSGSYYERRAAQQVMSVGGYVVYEWQPDPEEEWQTIAREWRQYVSTNSGIQWAPPKYVVLQGEQVRDDDVGVVAAMRSLSGLDLSKSAVTGRTLSVLAALNNLHTLDLSGTLLDDAGAASLPKFRSLCNLDLSGTLVKDQGTMSASKIRTLKRLDLNCTSIGDEGLVHLSSLSLQTLEIANTEITSNGLRHLERMTSLERLNLDGTSVDSAGVGRLTGLRRLKLLSLSHTAVDDECLSDLARLHNLEVLDLSYTRIVGGRLCELQSLNSLTMLLLIGLPLGDASSKQIGGILSIKALLLDDSTADDSAVGELRGKYLYLGLNHTRITDKSLDYLSTLETLRGLSVSGCAVTRDGVERFKIARPEVVIISD